VSSELANRLINAESVETFLRETPQAREWKTVSLLKTEVDRLVGSDLNRAERLAERIEQLVVSTGDTISKAFAEASRARVLHHLGRYLEADALYESSINAIRAGKLLTEAGILQMHRVFALAQMGRYTDALSTSRSARRALRNADPIHLAQLETNVGITYYRLDRYKKALEHYDRAHELFAAAGDDSMRASIDFNRSSIIAEMDRPAEALELLESAAEVMERTGQKLWAAQTRFHIAYLQFMRGNYNTALTSYYQAREQLTSLGSTQLVAWCNQEIAEILLALNAFDDAAESALVARARFQELGMPYESAQASVVHALALVGQKQYEQAESDLIRSRAVFVENGNKPLSALIDTYLAELALRRADSDEAARYSASSLRVFSRQKLSTRSAYARLLSARAAYQAGDFRKAARMAKSALKLVEGLFCPGVVYQCHHLLGRVERERKRGPAALDNFRRAVRTIETMRGGIAADEFKATFLRDKIEAYEDTIAACLDEGSDELIEEAFRLVESSKSRALADLLARYVRDIAQADAQGVESDARARLSKLIEDLNWYSSQAGLADDKGDQRSAELADRYRHAVARCERQVAQLFRRMEIEAPAFADIQRMQPVEAADLRGALDEGETVIEYFTTGNEVSAFIASPGGIKVVRAIESKREVERVLNALRFQIEKFNYGADYVEANFSQLKRATNERLVQLHKSLFAPLEGMIESDRLIIVPHGALHYVPFHALNDGTRYLVERFEMSYAPSAAVLKLCRERRDSLAPLKASNAGCDLSGGIISRSANSNNARASKSQGNKTNHCERDDTLVVLGLAEMGTPSIEEEIETLASLFPDAVKLTGAEATRDNLLREAPRARFLHLATHGYFRRDNPMFSFLKLADSQLNFYSLLDLKLKAELVTLSACHTGVNMVFPGDELHGLMRGFLYAGAPSVIASLWAVSDHSTSEFMREMYSRIRSGATKRAALRHAQLAIKDAYGHPYYWAPFILMGNPE
jgi:CHAT domain-containing protein/tetratricopeptide (TPR) repeat protein